MENKEKQNFEVYAMPNPRAYILKEDSKQNKYAKLDVVECDTPEKLEIIKNLPNIKWERKEVKKPKYNPSAWEDKDKQIEEMAEILRDKCFYYLSDTSVEASEKLAEELLKYYQPSLSENDVVLSKEEWLHLQGKAGASVFKDAQISQLEEELNTIVETIVNKIEAFILNEQVMKTEDFIEHGAIILFEDDVREFLKSLSNN